MEVCCRFASSDFPNSSPAHPFSPLSEKLLLAAVTGGNTGVGFEIVKALARDGRFRVVCASLPSHTLWPSCLFQAYSQIMCVKSLRRGHAALERLRAEGLTAEVIQVDISEPTRCRLPHFRLRSSLFNAFCASVYTIWRFLSREPTGAFWTWCDSMRVSVEQLLSSDSPVRSAADGE